MVLTVKVDHVVYTGRGKISLVQLIYAIGNTKLTSFTVGTMGTNISPINDETLSEHIAGMFSLTLRWIAEKFFPKKPSEKAFT